MMKDPLEKFFPCAISKITNLFKQTNAKCPTSSLASVHTKSQSNNSPVDNPTNKKKDIDEESEKPPGGLSSPNNNEKMENLKKECKKNCNEKHKKSDEQDTKFFTEEMAFCETGVNMRAKAACQLSIILMTEQLVERTQKNHKNCLESCNLQ